MNQHFVCDTHAFSLATPSSGRCLECIAEENADKRTYLAKAYEHAHSAAAWRQQRLTPTTAEGMQERVLQCLYNFTARAKAHGWKHSHEDKPVTVRDIEGILERQGNACVACFDSFNEVGFTVDHIVPIVFGGRHVVGNLQLLCQACNTSKLDRANADWLSEIRYRQVTRALQDIAEEEAITLH